MLATNVYSLVLAASSAFALMAGPQITNAPVFKRDNAINSLSSEIQQITNNALTYTALGDIFSAIESDIAAFEPQAATDAALASFISADQVAVIAEGSSLGISVNTNIAGGAAPASTTTAAGATTTAASASSTTTSSSAASSSKSASSSSATTSPSSSSSSSQIIVNFAALAIVAFAGFIVA
jgi:cobalamin biosynthesis Mg chelatase CobN